ncbi:MAG: 16S rRNA (cytosine(1402)-N(4))-methyltransferase RsmH [Betaproteobacteria bacterium]|nr:MAG: 16S rRNA (cytosine(1402)-N(4))-methyltransferase RsmH [Betaproteobacteria bacterium]
MSADAHLPVLLRPAVDALAIESRNDGTFVDATFGRGGHSRLILERLGPRGRLIGMDRDPEAIASARRIRDPRFTPVHARFSELQARLAALRAGGVDGVLFDLGVSSPQLDDPQRGFSFRSDGPLDMRMDPTRGQSAFEWLERADESEIREVLSGYGEERFAKQIAKAIVATRRRGPVRRTGELAALVAASARTREPGQDPATRTFQALRIHVNQELEELSLALPQALAVLDSRGRLAVISFHSLEDRIVKNFMRGAARPTLPERLPVRARELPPPKLRIVGRPAKPSAEEIRANPRSRSAVLRVAEKLP